MKFIDTLRHKLLVRLIGNKQIIANMDIRLLGPHNFGSIFILNSSMELDFKEHNGVYPACCFPVQGNKHLPLKGGRPQIRKKIMDQIYETSRGWRFFPGIGYVPDMRSKLI